MILQCRPNSILGDHGRGMLFNDSVMAESHRVQRKTIVSTTLPTIASQFGASQLEYTWVGVSYMLTQTAFQPLYGKLSDLIGRKVRCSRVSVLPAP